MRVCCPIVFPTHCTVLYCIVYDTMRHIVHLSAGKNAYELHVHNSSLYLVLTACTFLCVCRNRAATKIRKNIYHLRFSVSCNHKKNFLQPFILPEDFFTLVRIEQNSDWLISPLMWLKISKRAARIFVLYYVLFLQLLMKRFESKLENGSCQLLCIPDGLSYVSIISDGFGTR